MDIKKLTAEDIAKLDDDAIKALVEETRAAFDERRDADAPTAEVYAEAQILADNLDLIDADADRRVAEAKEIEEGMAALKERKFGDDRDEVEESEESEPEGEEESEEEAPAEDAEVVEAETGEVEAPEAAAPVAAASKTTAGTKTTAKVVAKGGVKTLAAKRRTSTDDTPQGRALKPVSLVAAAGAPDQTAGARLEMDEMAEAVIAQASRFTAPSGDGKSTDLHRFATGKIEIQFPEELMVDRLEDIADDQISAALDESQLKGGSLVAAGGWCAPSETVYDLDQDATTEGMVSLPEIGIRRGGLRYAQSPDFSAFYANPGFIQTEAQAIAGTTKPCVEVACPGFVDVRLDVEGLCIKVPILTNVGYPEAVSNFISGTLVAHQHWINANVIGRLVTASGALRSFTTGMLGSAASDALSAIALVIVQRRQKHRLALKATMEVILPFWAKEVFRNDIGRRTGRDKSSVSDAEINSHFTSIGANVQYVYDWQLLDETAEVWPSSFKALIYPAGTFVKGVQPVISLDTVYDAASLAVNTYTGLFTEQAFLVAKKKLDSDYVDIPICMAGRTGAANLTCP